MRTVFTQQCIGYRLVSNVYEVSRLRRPPKGLDRVAGGILGGDVPKKRLCRGRLRVRHGKPRAELAAKGRTQAHVSEPRGTRRPA